MATRFDASGDMLTRTASLPSSDAITLMAWFQIVTDRNNFSTFFQFGHATADTSVYQLQTAADGTTLNLWNGSSTSSSGAQNLAVGTWYHLAMVNSAQTGTGLFAYVNGVQNLSGTSRNTGQIPSSKLWIGNSIASEWLNGRVAAFKFYGAALTAQEILQEMWTYRPQRMANLIGWHPLLNTVSEFTKDFYSGTDLTAGGTLTAEDGPPITWGRSKRRRRIFLPSGVVGVNLNGSAVGAGATAGSLRTLRNLVGLAAGLGVDTASLQVLKALAGSVSARGYATGILQPTRAFSGSPRGLGQSSGSAQVSRTPSGAASGQGSTSGASQVSRSLIGVTAGSGSTFGSLSAIVPLLLSGSAAGVASLIASLQVSRTFAGQAAGIGQTAGSARIERDFAAVALGLATVTGSLSIAGALLLIGLARGASNAAGSLQVARWETGSTRGAGQVLAANPVGKVWTGAAAGQGRVSAAVQIQRAILGQSLGDGSTDAVMQLGRALISAAQGRGATTASPEIRRLLAGVTRGQAQAIGSLFVQGAIVRLQDLGLRAPDLERELRALASGDLRVIEQTFGLRKPNGG